MHEELLKKPTELDPPKGIRYLEQKNMLCNVNVKEHLKQIEKTF